MKWKHEKRTGPECVVSHKKASKPNTFSKAVSALRQHLRITPHNFVASFDNKEKKALDAYQLKVRARRVSYSQMVTSLKRILRSIIDKPRSPSNFQVSAEGTPNALLAYDEVQKIKTQLLEMERLKAEAIRLVRERSRCI